VSQVTPLAALPQVVRKARLHVRQAATGLRQDGPAVNLLLMVIWLVTGAGFPWFVFPLAGSSGWRHTLPASTS
jgi:hypothetical protein